MMYKSKFKAPADRFFDLTSDQSDEEDSAEGKTEEILLTKKRKVESCQKTSEGIEQSTLTRSKEFENYQGFFLSSIPDLGREANEFCLSFSDILSGEFYSGLFTNYMVDIEWMVKQSPRLEAIPWTLIHGERDVSNIERLCQNYPNVKLHKPPLPISYGTHHTKMAILFYESGVRISIMTNNFIEIDWQGKSQGIWVQDFPIKDLECEETSQFEDDLVDYIRHLGGPAAPFCRDLRRYEFSSANVMLVPCVPGYHRGNDLSRYGHLKLRQFLSKENIPQDKRNSPIICQCSSLGSINENWIQNELLLSMAPPEPEVESNHRSKGPRVKPEVQFIWPTVNDVQNSMMGYASGGSIPGSIKNIFGSVENAKRNFPKPFLSNIFHKWKGETRSNRGRAMPHIKSYLQYHVTEESQVEYLWFLLTSCNLSKAAWGSVQKNGSQLMIRSYEMGVLFLPSVLAAKNICRTFSCTPNHPLLGLHQRSDEKSSLIKKLKGNSTSDRIKLVNFFKEQLMLDDLPKVLFPIPYQIPPARYDETDQPWAWDRPYEKPDVFGQTWQC